MCICICICVQMYIHVTYRYILYWNQRPVNSAGRRVTTCRRWHVSCNPCFCSKLTLGNACTIQLVLNVGWPTATFEWICVLASLGSTCFRSMHRRTRANAHKWKRSCQSKSPAFGFSARMFSDSPWMYLQRQKSAVLDLTLSRDEIIMVYMHMYLCPLCISTHKYVCSYTRSYSCVHLCVHVFTFAYHICHFRVHA